ncbi:hypothetical protein WBJ53_03305 [Spirosoma sp. SC4-14]|uniref:hypothetical protein n=1 Tax=Spirosoma sp. SC4-14 TaxID=3128900 RepID=UPI0030D286F2
MTLLLSCGRLLSACLFLLVSIESFAQKPVIEQYRVRVITKTGQRLRGILDDVTESHLTVMYSYVGTERVPLENVRKVVLRRANKKTVQITGAIVGGLLVGFIANQSLENSPARSPILHGLTVVFAAAGGATGGLILSSAIGNLTSRIIRPLDPANPDLSLRRQLEPFSIRYQQDLLNRLPKSR